MGNPKILKLAENVDIRDIVVPLILHLENKSNYIVQIEKLEKGFSFYHSSYPANDYRLVVSCIFAGIRVDKTPSGSHPSGLRIRVK